VEKVLEMQSANSKDEFALESSGVCDLLTVERICIPLNARTRNSVIEQLCEFAAETGALWLPKEMAEAVRQREELHPTALENGVALLHPRRPQPGLFSEPFLALGITPSGIPYGGPRGCLTDIFFLIASSHDAFHLRILARLSRLIQLNGLLDRLRAASDAQQAFQAMIEAESQI
jgi:PTS system nitrogen regulatory IIA component